MILQDGDPIVAISQPSHSWLSGQLARAWGNQQFHRFEPFEPICLAAEQHDVGFLQWEREPVLDPETGLPYNFDSLPEPMHFDLWAGGISQLRPVCWYSALILRPLPPISSRVRQRPRVRSEPLFARAESVSTEQYCPAFYRSDVQRCCDRRLTGVPSSSVSSMGPSFAPPLSRPARSVQDPRCPD
jgi:uncharacterized protein DUF3891